MLNLGLIINPWAGIGGAVALKGSDGAFIREEALRLGAVPQAEQRVRIALEHLQPFADSLHFFTASEGMGANVLTSLGFEHTVVFSASSPITTAEDTKQAVMAIQLQHLGLVIFAGGDGTARDVCTIVGEDTPVLGIPAGVKIHSAVYSVSPTAAGEILKGLCTGAALELVNAQVKDLDEVQYRQGLVKSKLFGYMKVPASPLMQQSKESARVTEPEHIHDIVEHVCEGMDNDTLYLIGAGTTCAALKEALSMDLSLLGVDAYVHSTQVAKDATSSEILSLLSRYTSVKLVVTVIGGQGHLFGRGNQQLSAEVLKRIGRENILVIASPGKLQSLNGRPFRLDTGDAQLDKSLAGPINVITGYHSEALYVMS